MDGKIKILFYTLDSAGVAYFRTLTPAMEIERNHSDEFYVEINPQINFNDPKFVDYLKSFHIIHYHRQFLSDSKQMLNLANELRKSGTILICDIDDYWQLHKKHPFYSMSLEKKLYIPILENLKIADYVTTTTDLFANEIRKVTGRDNVGVFYNSVDPTWMKQFQNNWKPDPDGRVRISYMAGSSHMVDIEQLEGVMNVLSNDTSLRDKFKVIIAGWDTEGNTTDITFNQEFGTELQKRGLWVYEVVKAINNSRGDVDKIPKLPADLKEKYRGKIFDSQQRDIKSTESVYYLYENILTDKHRMINNPDYYQWLHNFERNVDYPNEGNFARRWTQKANTYAQVLNETDIVLAPLADNSFNRMKCVTEDTLISTNKGIYKIGDIVNNSCKDIKIMHENVINLFKYPNERVIKLTTHIGVEIEGTETHRIMVGGEWKMLKDFEIGDLINISPFEIETKEYQRIHYPLLLSKRITETTLNNSTKLMMPSIEINENYGRFFGYMVGDGHFSKGYLNISCDKRHINVVQDIKELVESMGLMPIIYEKKPDSRCINSYIKEGFGIEVRIPSKHLANICYQENLRDEKGKIFEVPHFILKSPKSVIREFLRGLFEADGTVNAESSNMSLCTKSFILAKQVQYLLLGFGIVSIIDKALNKKYKRYYYYVKLNRDASDIFYSEIGFISEIKCEKLKRITEKLHSNRFMKQSFNTTILNVEYSVKDVYDVEVENIHQYNGNGIINHNSNLKQVECWTRKLPIVCSDIPPYNVHGRHMENCVLIPAVKNAHKYWQKYLKRLILNPDLRKQIGEQLYEDFKEDYNLANVTKKRIEFYKAAVAKTLAVI
jgi:intein/homing endonuclease